MQVVEVWRDGWSSEYSTVPPIKTTIAAIITVRRLERKGLRLGRDYKLLIHYAQPHAPYRLLARRLAPLLELARKRIAVTPLDTLAKGMITPDMATLGILYDTLREKKRVDHILRLAYKDNLKWALNALRPLLTSLRHSRLIITADHGELLGEHGLYFHFEAPLPQLRIVPWHVVGSAGAHTPHRA